MTKHRVEAQLLRNLILNLFIWEAEADSAPMHCSIPQKPTTAGAGPQPNEGAKNSTQGSLMASKTPATWAIAAASQACVGRKLESEARVENATQALQRGARASSLLGQTLAPEILEAGTT